jgi:FkbM family methyltransferase
VHPDDISSESVIYSCGVGDDISFDLSLIGKYGVTINAFDPTPKSIAWIRSQSVPLRFVLHESGIAGYDGRALLHPPANARLVSHTILPQKAHSDDDLDVPVRRIRTLMQELGHARIEILKMDIEGAEYAVIQDVLESQLDVRQILVEFHDRFPTVGWARTVETVAEMLHGGYRLFNIEDDNYSFVRD